MSNEIMPSQIVKIACFKRKTMYVPVFIVQTDPIHARISATIRS